MLLSAIIFSQLTSAVYSHYSGESIMLPQGSFVKCQSQKAACRVVSLWVTPL